MNPSANILSSETLVQFQASVLDFADKAKEALITMDMDIQRTQQWLDDMARYWRTEKGKAEDAVLAASVELKRKRMMRIGDRPADTTDQELALRKAKARLDRAEEKVEHCKHWLRTLPDEVLDYQGPARNLMTMVENRLPLWSAILGQKIDTLEQYGTSGS